MKYLIIGLGIYGSNLAVDLTNIGHEVIGADINPTLVEALKDNLSTAYIVDSTDETALKMLPLLNVDVVIVAIGENFGASLRTVALLKSLGVKHIYARAVDKLHESILEGFNIDRILTPEQRAASDLVLEMELGGDIQTLRVDDKTFVMKFRVPAFFNGMRYSELNFPKNYNLAIIAVTRAFEATNIVGMSSHKTRLLDIAGDDTLTVEEGDVLTCLGTAGAYRDFCIRIHP